MFKKILATFLIISLSTAFATEINAQKSQMESELAQTFDELNYKLNVEWNQSDVAFFNESMNSFESQVSALQAKGLSGQDLVNFTMSRIKDQSAQAEVKAIANAISTGKMSSEEARAFALTKLNNIYAQGTSWSGSRLALKVALLVAAIIVVVLVVKKLNEDDDSSTEEEVPGDDEEEECQYEYPSYDQIAPQTYNECYYAG